MSSLDTKTCTKCGVEKALTEFYKNKKVKDGLLSKCKICVCYQSKQWRENNKDRARKTDQQKYKRNRERKREQAKQWYDNNLERARETRRNRYKNNRESVLKYCRQRYQDNADHYREYARQWRRNNLGLRNANNASRRAAKLQRTPPWVDREAIKAVYDEAHRLTVLFGEPWHVDHVYPLQGDTVSGLHVAENLRVLPAVENLRKSNVTLDELQLRGLFE